MLAMSGLFHLHGPGGAKEYFRRYDHVGIWVVIAGCFTPVHIILFRGFWRWAPLVVVWVAAIAGLVMKLWWFDLVSRPVSVGLYATLSLFGVVTAWILFRERGLKFVRPLLVCGAIYLAGGVMFFLRWPNPIPGVLESHQLWHAAVLGAALFHWNFVGQIVAEPEVAPVPARAEPPPDQLAMPA